MTEMCANPWDRRRENRLRTAVHDMATASSESTDTNELRVIEDATCIFCGCVCDDIDLTTDGHKIVDAKRACVLGTAWFLNHEAEHGPSCRIDGKPASVKKAWNAPRKFWPTASIR